MKKIDFSKLLPPKEDHIRDEYKLLIERGNVTYEEFANLRCNSWEFEAFYQVLTDDALLQVLENNILPNCARVDLPATTYDKAVIGVFTPLLIKRLRELLNRY